MKKYIIDANLPYYFSLWKNDAYEHVIDWDDVLAMSKEYKLIRVYTDKIERIG